MKKILLTLSLLLGVCVAKAATVEEICGNYNVNEFSGYECYWYSLQDYNWHNFSFNNYVVKVSQVEGNTVKLTGLISRNDEITGEFNAADNTIVFPTQNIYVDGYYYIFTVEQWDDSNIVVNREANVVATITEDGNIDLSGWTVVYDYGNDTYWTYFSGTKVVLAPYAGEVELKDVTKIVGTYNVSSFAGYESCWYTTTDEEWHQFNYGQYEVTLTQVEGNTVKLNNVTYYGESIVGEYDPENACIVFKAQEIDIQGYKYFFCAEQWDDDGNIVVDMESSVTATIASQNDAISFGGWTLASKEDDGYWAYFSGVNAVLLPNPDSNVESIVANDLNAPVRYYNLNGMNVAGTNLAPGIYIVKQGNNVRKVLVK